MAEAEAGAGTQIPSAANSAQKIVDTMHGIVQDHAPLMPGIGKVITPPPDIQIAWNNIILTKEQIYINEYWLVGHTRTHKGHIVSGTQPAGHHTHTHGIDNDYTDVETKTDTLKPGDLVSVYPQEGGQLFLVENKVVKL